MMRLKAFLLLIVTIAFALGPVLFPGFGGFDPDLYPVPQIDPPVQPAGYAFAIWGVIYLWLLVHAVFGLSKRAQSSDWDAPRWSLILSLAIGAIWLPTAQISAVWATVEIFAMLFFALIALFSAHRETGFPKPQVTDPWLLTAPIALYAGWLTAASFAALAILGAGFGAVLGQIAWALLALAGALTVGSLVQLLRPSATLYAVGIGWALIGIAVHNWGTVWIVAIPSLIATVIIAGVAFLGLLKPEIIK
ncbi:hypothetical protein AQS8620_02575 [Aquimixticola soesokkakensis]|uniref:TspO/MBR family protein n=1 Tax=Aquimixticola soesokkakensis TaxID=1519096 RepID=A0A1Y5TAW9_9RHOB|nr:hypothetical protein [Aquimixticola soesokkakensis]SLN57767.1 hypothetical protein AQS8620_02575 [Aquimixticola soesokkakensis]